MSRCLILTALLLSISACRTPEKEDTGQGVLTCTYYADSDADGFGDAGSASDSPCGELPAGMVDDATDCDDGDATIHPGAEEYCNDLDDDCDGDVDEGATDLGVYYADSDADGFGDPDSPIEACSVPSGHVDDSTDCDDGDDEIHPGAAERCDGVDNDCDDLVDEDLQELWYADTDADGYGNAEVTLDSCDPGAGWVGDDTDCDDGDATVNPGSAEICNDLDDDCNGLADDGLESTWFADEDSDGFGDPGNTIDDCEPGTGWTQSDLDCDDANSDIHPDASEACNGYDDDCDGLVDDDDPDITDMISWYLDTDGDGYGSDDTTTSACEQPSGYATYGGDCDDSDPAYNPGASESDCTDPADYNCDGSTGYTDGDGDGWAACEDCDDSDAAVNPDATETCNSVDDDCDGTVDEDDASDALTWYADDDGDGHGDATTTTVACDEPSGFTANAEDCDDSDPTVSPSAAESCNGTDDDCDGDTDEGVQDTYFADADADGYGDAGATMDACELPSGYSTDDSDCDDGDTAVNPGATELCNSIDDDCDGNVDEDDAADTSTWYADDDNDGYGDLAAVTTACAQPSGFVADSSDCDDDDDDVHPGADETCDGVDEDCDGTVDEQAIDGDTWYADSDTDGYGDASDSVQDCNHPSGTVDNDDDCDDTDATINPAATEQCDSADNDCDGTVDEDDASDATTWYADADGDGYGDAASASMACTQPSGSVADSTDCDDGSAAINPSATELCDGVDNDCDGSVDEADASDATTWYADSDGDGFGDASSSTVSCYAPAGFVASSGDCDDDDAGISPAATELCDSVDNDCDGTVDEADAADAATWYADADADGYGDPSSTSDACSQPGGYVADDDDCDDGDAAVNPAATELCDGVDNDCDGTIDEADATDATTWYIDTDSDGFGSSAYSQLACDQPTGFVSDSTDCDDGDSATNPGATELCDGADNDCDGTVDEGVLTTWYLDLDNDGYGDDAYTSEACTAPSGLYVADGGDCDDSDSAYNPGASPGCDGEDYDCDGAVDNDADGDGYADSTCGGDDCDDTDPTITATGEEYECPAEDCDDVLTVRPSAGDGNYWIDPDGSGDAFEIFCDMSSEGGGWTLAAHIDDVNDPYFEAQTDEPWETDSVRNETTFPSMTSDIAVSAKYATWSRMAVTDMYIYYKNDDVYFLCEGLDWVDTLDVIFSDTPTQGYCSANCTSWSEDRMPEASMAPVGLNCSDPNEGWMTSTAAENARVGALSTDIGCCVYNGFIGAAGDRGFATSDTEKTWAAYYDGEIEDNNIMVFVR